MPVAGIDDPGQFLMIRGINKNPKLFAFNGVHDKFFGILRTAFKYNPDYIHFDWIESYYFRRHPIFTYLSIPAFLIQLWICRYLLNIKIGWTLHNLIPHDKRQANTKRFIQRQFAKYIKFVRVLSPGSIESAALELNLKKNKIHFIATGSFIDYYPNTTDRLTAKKHMNFPTDQRIVLFLGSIKRYKGIIELIHIFNTVKTENSKLVIAGKSYDAKYLEEIKALVSDDILLIDRFIDNRELQFLYGAADVVVCPFTEIENSGSVIMAAGFRKAVIAPGSNVINFRLCNQKELLYNPGELSAVLSTALKMNQDQLDEFGQLNYNHLNSFQWEDFGNMFIN